MSIFAVALKKSNEQVEQRIKDAYPDHYSLSRTFFLVSSEELSEDVAMRAGIKGENRIPDASGAVFALRGAYSGYTTGSIWEWLTNHEDDFR